MNLNATNPPQISSMIGLIDCLIVANMKNDSS